MNLRGVVRAALRDEWDGLGSIFRDIRIADMFTILNALAGATAMLLATSGRATLAAQALMLSILLDGLDGIVARGGGRFGGGPLGPVLDTLADAIAFVAAPAVVAAAWAGGLDAPWWLLTAVAWYAACGLLRLARFESLRSPAPTRYFSGLPSPAGALAFLAVWAFPAASHAMIAAVMAAAGSLMISRVRYPKLRGTLGAAAAAIILVALIGAQTSYSQFTAWLLFGFLAFFFLAGPFYVLARVGPTSHPEVQA